MVMVMHRTGSDWVYWEGGGELIQLMASSLKDLRKSEEPLIKTRNTDFQKAV